jgi:aminopeptidase YwaD
VVARFPGSTRKTIILGAHMDSKAPSPGANDNGSGCGALLEIARCLGQRHAYPTVELVFFGAEEMIDADPDHHHFGSRYHVKDMSAGARKNAAGMISVDMIGYGPHFVVRTMGNGPQSLRRLLMRQARERGIHLSYLRDPGESGWSDHEAFELAGIPAAWIEWRDDPVYHTSADTSGHLVATKVRIAGQFVLGVLYGMDAAALERLAR